jgi:hypothetical protein
MRGEETGTHDGILTRPRGDAIRLRECDSRDPSAVNNRHRPRVQKCKAVDELKRWPVEVADFKCRCRFGYAQDEKLGSLCKEPLHDWASHAADAFRTAAVMIREPELKKDQEKRQSVSKLSPWSQDTGRSPAD